MLPARRRRGISRSINGRRRISCPKIDGKRQDHRGCVNQRIARCRNDALSPAVNVEFEPIASALPSDRRSRGNRYRRFMPHESGGAFKHRLLIRTFWRGLVDELDWPYWRSHYREASQQCGNYQASAMPDLRQTRRICLERCTPNRRTPLHFMMQLVVGQPRCQATRKISKGSERGKGRSLFESKSHSVLGEFPHARRVSFRVIYVYRLVGERPSSLELSFLRSSGRPDENEILRLGQVFEFELARIDEVRAGARSRARQSVQESTSPRNSTSLSGRKYVRRNFHTHLAQRCRKVRHDAIALVRQHIGPGISPLF